ncbi:helix-turn-helix domain-containing protein [Halodesulfovibrio aestuarii]|uniref:helix-turn-helix domain-containing protein n=1 Tax=Halodesulfovibrio aestuarii TaxID=126333 RepID=UPI003D34A61C
MKEFFIQKCENAFSPVPNWVQRLAGLTMGAKLTYGRLLQCANNEGVAWPSQRYLSKELGCSLRSIVTYIGELKKHDLILVSKVCIGEYPRTVYRFVIPNDQRSIPESNGFTPSVIADDADIFFNPEAGAYLYTAPAEQTKASPTPEPPHISSAPAPAQNALNGSAPECKPCVGVRNSCTEGTQHLPEGYAGPAPVYNEDKNKGKDQGKETKPHPLDPPHNISKKLPNSKPNTTTGEGYAYPSPTFPYSPRNHTTPTEHPTLRADNRSDCIHRSSSATSQTEKPSSFEAVWELYPLKQGKIPAQRCWNSLFKSNKLPNPTIILASIKAHIASDSRWQRGIIPNLDRWLRDGRWTDEPYAAPESKNPTSTHKTNLEAQALKQLALIRKAVHKSDTPISDPITNELLDSHGGLTNLSRMPERNLPFILGSFVKEYVALVASKKLETVYA